MFDWTAMLAEVDPRSATPLYAQIATRLRMAVASGDIKPGDPLPSVRQLATRLRINPATVVQAYRELETEGFAEMRQGAGTFVREMAPDKRSRERARQAKRLVQEMISEAGKLGLSSTDLVPAIQEELGARAV